MFIIWFESDHIIEKVGVVTISFSLVPVGSVLWAIVYHHREAKESIKFKIGSCRNLAEGHQSSKS